MIELKLLKASQIYKSQYIEFVTECKEDIKKCGMSFYMPLSDNDSFYEDIQQLINNEKGDNLPDGWVPSTTYWLMRKNDERILGGLTVRHSLSESLLFRGGHISYYIRLSERCKGYATYILKLSLKECKTLGINRVMITCAKSNIGSLKIIQKNGGILHSEDIENGEEFLRFWIDNN